MQTDDKTLLHRLFGIIPLACSHLLWAFYLSVGDSSLSGSRKSFALLKVETSNFVTCESKHGFFPPLSLSHKKSNFAFCIKDQNTPILTFPQVSISSDCNLPQHSSTRDKNIKGVFIYLFPQSSPVGLLSRAICPICRRLSRSAENLFSGRHKLRIIRPTICDGSL